MSKNHQEAALKRGENRSADIERKVLCVMATIEAEIKKNGGVYPENGGAISKNEVARRAGIGPSTLFSPKQQQLGSRVSKWIEEIQESAVTRRERAQRTYAERAAEWKKEFETIVTQFRIVELELQTARSEYDEALTSIETLKSENQGLLEQLRNVNNSKVTPFKKRDN